MDIDKKISAKNVNIDRLHELINEPVDIMQNKTESELNPLGYQLTTEAKKRLKWMYIIQTECGYNVSQAAKKIGVSRPWLSKLYHIWIESDRDPRSLEPESKAPNNTDRRNRISDNVEEKIIAARKKYHWGKDKLITILDREYHIQIGASTINRCLSRNGLLDIKIANRIRLAHQNKIEQTQKCRPPKEIKDYKPGALVEKDMKFIMKTGKFTNPNKPKAKENFWNQHTVIDSFTRIRTIGLAEDGESKTAVAVQTECEKRFPFPIACANTDNGSENEKDFDCYLAENKIVHFYSRSGTPTDNPRVERSHLTDEMEFYQHANLYMIRLKNRNKNYQSGNIPTTMSDRIKLWEI